MLPNKRFKAEQQSSVSFDFLRDLKNLKGFMASSAANLAFNKIPSLYDLAETIDKFIQLPLDRSLENVVQASSVKEQLLEVFIQLFEEYQKSTQDFQALVINFGIFIAKHCEYHDELKQKIDSILALYSEWVEKNIKSITELSIEEDTIDFDNYANHKKNIFTINLFELNQLKIKHINQSIIYSLKFLHDEMITKMNSGKSDGTFLQITTVTKEKFIYLISRENYALLEPFTTVTVLSRQQFGIKSRAIESVQPDGKEQVKRVQPVEPENWVNNLGKILWQGNQSEQSSYSSPDDAYAELYGPIYSEILRHFVNYLLDIKEKRPNYKNLILVELACKDANLLKLFTKRAEELGFNVLWKIGLDYNKEFIDHLSQEKNPSWFFAQSDVINTRRDLLNIFKQNDIKYESQDTLTIFIASGIFTSMVLTGTRHSLIPLQQIHSLCDAMFLCGAKPLLTHNYMLKFIGYDVVYSHMNYVVIEGKKFDSLLARVKKDLARNPTILDLQMCADPLKVIQALSEDDMTNIKQVDISYCTFNLCHGFTTAESNAVKKILGELKKILLVSPVNQIEYSNQMHAPISESKKISLYRYTDIYHACHEWIKDIFKEDDIEIRDYCKGGYLLALETYAQLPGFSPNLRGRINKEMSKTIEINHSPNTAFRRNSL